MNQGFAHSQELFYIVQLIITEKIILTGENRTQPHGLVGTGMLCELQETLKTTGRGPNFNFFTLE